jgi:glycosyltransferase involved in cell wall biosynthesis
MGLRWLGEDALAGSIQEHKFGYQPDVRIDLTGDLSASFRTVQELADQFDVFHLHARSFFSVWPQQTFPSLLDLIILKERGCKVFFHFRGQEIRLASLFERHNRFNYVSEAGSEHLFAKMPDEAKLASLDFIRGVCDGIFVTDPELQTYVPEAIIIPRALRLDDWPFIGVGANAKPIIVHAPSRRGVKGTKALLDALDDLEAEGLQFSLNLIEGIPHEQAKIAYERADIVVDQLRIGWYGVLATEAMALGKPTVAYIRDDLWQQHGSDLPIMNANPETIRDVLRELILDPRRRQEASARSREFFLKTHSSDSVCARLAEIYRVTPRRPIDWEVVGRFMARQQDIEKSSTIKIIKAMKRQIRTQADLLSAANARDQPPVAKNRFRRLSEYHKRYGTTKTVRLLTWKVFGKK